MKIDQYNELEQFKFLQVYDKESVLKYIGALHLYKENSSFSRKLSRLTIQTLINCKGEKAVDDTFATAVNDNYKYESSEDPQEFLFIDTVHTSHKTFRVFPGMFSNLQHNLSRFFSIAFHNQIDETQLKYSLFFLHLSDSLAQRLGYCRHEIGFPDQDTIYYPLVYEVNSMLSIYTLDYQEILDIANQYGITDEEFKGLLYVHDEIKLREFDEYMNGYSPVETNPLYKLEDNRILIIQPSALLSAAHAHALLVLQCKLRDKFNLQYNEELTFELIHSCNNVEESCIGRGLFDTATSLLLLVDKDKLLVPIIVADPEILLNIDTVNTGIESYLKDKYIDFRTQIVYCYNTTEIGLSIGFTNGILLFDFDDFRTILTLSNFSLKDIWYYCEDRNNLTSNVHGQEIDLFEFYRGNLQTFYINAFSTTLLPVVGNALTLRFDSSRNLDEHVLKFRNVCARVRHFNDFPLFIPIYRGANISTQNELIGELLDCTIILMVKPNYEYETICFEVCKSILIWLHVIEKRFKKPIIKGEISSIILFDDNISEPTLLYNEKKNLYKYQLPIGKNDDSYGIIERNILESFLRCLLGNGELVNPEFFVMLNTVFSECEGHILQGPDYPDVLLEDDGIKDCYEVNDRCCDIVLSEIADILQTRGKEVILTREDSKKVALQVQDYLGNRIDSILKSIETKKFLTYLLRLHHSLQFWKYNVNQRFYNINAIMKYIGGVYENQIHSAELYTQTDGLTCFLIERIIARNINCISSNPPSNEDADMLFAYSKQYYTVCQYLDLLTKITEGSELRILESGRICYPTSLLDKYMSFFSDLREEDFFYNKIKNQKQELFPEYRIKKSDTFFYEAFREEFGISFEDYTYICQSCIDYGIQNGGVICLQEADFKNIIVQNNNSINYSDFKSQFVLSHNVIVERNLRDSEFWPHRYNRKFQISSRPWIKFNDRIYFSNKSISMSNRILLERLNEGIHNARTKKMKAYMGNINHEKGLLFNNSVFSFISSNCTDNVIVRKEVPIKPGKELNSELDLGDIDILIIDNRNKIIKAIELKNYIECRYLWKVIEQENQIKEDLAKVRLRNQWCKKHIQLFSQFSRYVNEEYEYQTLFLTYNLPPELFRSDIDEEIKFVTLLDVISNPNLLCCKTS